MALPLESRVSQLETQHDDLDNRVQHMEDGIASLRAEIANSRTENKGDFKAIQDGLAGLQRAAWESVPKWAADDSKDQAERLRNANHSLGIMIGVIVSLLAIVGVLLTSIAVHAL